MGVQAGSARTTREVRQRPHIPAAKYGQLALFAAEADSQIFWVGVTVVCNVGNTHQVHVAFRFGPGFTASRVRRPELHSVGAVGLRPECPAGARLFGILEQRPYSVPDTRLKRCLDKLGLRFGPYYHMASPSTPPAATVGHKMILLLYQVML